MISWLMWNVTCLLKYNVNCTIDTRPHFFVRTGAVSKVLKNKQLWESPQHTDTKKKWCMFKVSIFEQIDTKTLDRDLHNWMKVSNQITLDKLTTYGTTSHSNKHNLMNSDGNVNKCIFCGYLKICPQKRTRSKRFRFGDTGNLHSHR